MVHTNIIYEAKNWDQGLFVVVFELRDDFSKKEAFSWWDTERILVKG